MTIAAGKSGGKPPRITDNAFKPPTEAAMATTGNLRLAGKAGVVLPAVVVGFFVLGFDLDFVIMIINNSRACSNSARRRS